MHVGLCLITCNSTYFLLLLAKIYFHRSWKHLDSLESNCHLPEKEVEKRNFTYRTYIYQTASCKALEADIHPYFADEEMKFTNKPLAQAVELSFE